METTTIQNNGSSKPVSSTTEDRNLQTSPVAKSGSPSEKAKPETPKEQAMQDTPKEYTAEEIFAMMTPKTKNVKALHTDITELEKKIAGCKERRAKLSASIRVVRRLERKYNPHGVQHPKVSPHDRKVIKVEIKAIDNQMILLEDELATKKAELGTLAADVTDTQMKDKLRNKAQSKTWTKKNKRHVAARLVKTLNLILSENVARIQELARLATSKAEDSKVRFDNALWEELEAYDKDTSILCSHQLKGEMYEAVRLTLAKWNARSAPEFTELIYPEQQ